MLADGAPRAIRTARRRTRLASVARTIARTNAELSRPELTGDRNRCREFYSVRRLPPYVFEQVNRLKASARAAGADIIDLGMGNPDLPTPPHIVEKLAETARRDDTHGYSASRGITGLRKAQAAYYDRRFGVKLDPEHAR